MKQKEQECQLYIKNVIRILLNLKHFRGKGFVSNAKFIENASETFLKSQIFNTK